MGLFHYYKLATCLTCLLELIFFIFLKLFFFSIHSSMLSLLVIELHFFFILIFIRSSCFHSILVLLSNKIVETS